MNYFLDNFGTIYFLALEWNDSLKLVTHVSIEISKIAWPAHIVAFRNLF